MEELLGKIITDIKVSRNNGDSITFTLDTGEKYKMHHYQDCCEFVTIDDINGDLEDLLNSPITMASVVSSNKDVPGLPEGRESFTWTFYKLATVKGYVDIRWYGESNGYYSEHVDFDKID